jgi:hypothetical protein
MDQMDQKHIVMDYKTYFHAAKQSYVLSDTNNHFQTSIIFSILVDRGLVEYEKPIAHYWPDFAQGGKENVTVTDLLQHVNTIIHLTLLGRWRDLVRRRKSRSRRILD